MNKRNHKELSHKGEVQSGPDSAATRNRWIVPALLAVLVVAAGLRMVRLDISPPGISQDEAGAWDAQCLLETGRDQTGESWPVFYARCLGGNRTTLHIYYLLPFQAIGGLSVEVIRFASAVAGVAAVALVFYVGRAFFGPLCGLLAAALMALNPWAIRQSRWAHEATLVPLLVLAPIALMLWARLPLIDDDKPTPRIFLAALAGVVAGIACYGYPVVRLFLPLFLCVAAAVSARRLWHLVRTRSGLLAVGGFVLGFAVTFGPLAYKHLTDPAINQRGETTRAWSPDASLGEKFETMSDRYWPHFGMDFLFVIGDEWPANHVPGYGLYHPYMLPLMVVGAGVLFWRLRRSHAARILLVWILLYPISDTISKHMSAHALRSLAGLPALVVLGALGAMALWEAMQKWKRPIAYAAAGTALVVVVAVNGAFFYKFFGSYNQREDVCEMFHCDLVAASRWLGGRLDEYDAVFVTTHEMRQPQVVMAIAMDYPPEKWFAERRHVVSPGEWDLYLQVGKIHYMYGGGSNVAWVRTFNAMRGNERTERALFIVRPGQLQAYGIRSTAEPVKEFSRNGQALHLYDVQL